jgi:predicted nucleotidyltransferase
MDAEKLLKEKRQAIMALADKYEAHSVQVFGSIARGDSGPESDVDLW